MDTIMPPTYEELAARLQAMEAEMAGLRIENAWLKRQLFGPGKSEKIDRLQTSLPLEETPTAPAKPWRRSATNGWPARSRNGKHRLRPSATCR